MESRRTRTRSLVSAALVAALMGATSWLSLHVAGPVPITPQMFFVVLAALLLPPGWAAGSMAVYVVLGAAGLPIFSGGKGGIGILAGPTGGYIFGFVLAAAVGALARVLLERRHMSQMFADTCAALVALVVAYAVGSVQLGLVAGLGPVGALTAGVVPFIVPDAIKAFVAVAAAAAIRRARA